MTPRKFTSFRWQAVALLVLLSILVAACGGAKSSTPNTAGQTPAATSPSAQAPAPKEKKSIKMGYLNVMDDAQAMLAKDAGLYEKHGLDVELVLFTSGTDLIKAIVGGQLHAGVLGFTNAVTWASQGADLKVVAGAQMGYHSILVPPGSSIKKVEDLKGKRLASQRQGSTADIVLMGATFKQASLGRNDVNFVYVEPPQAIQSLAAGQVDAAFVFEPYEQIAKVVSGATAIYEVGTVWPFPCMVVITTGDQLKKDRDAIDRALDAHKEAMLMMQKEPAKSAQYIYKRFVAEEELTGHDGKKHKAVDVIQKAIETQMFHWDISNEDIARMKEIIDIMHDMKLIQQKVDVNAILDLEWQKKPGNTRPVSHKGH